MERRASGFLVKPGYGLQADSTTARGGGAGSGGRTVCLAALRRMSASTPEQETGVVVQRSSGRGCKATRPVCVGRRLARGVDTDRARDKAESTPGHRSLIAVS